MAASWLKRRAKMAMSAPLAPISQSKNSRDAWADLQESPRPGSAGGIQRLPPLAENPLLVQAQLSSAAGEEDAEESPEEESDDGVESINSEEFAKLTSRPSGRRDRINNPVHQPSLMVVHGRHAGHFGDFLERRRVAALAIRLFALSADHTMDLNAQELMTAKMDMNYIIDLHKEVRESDDGLIADGKFMLHQEKLWSDIWYLLVGYKKQQPVSKGGWEKTPKGKLKEWASKIIDLRARTNKNHTEVNGNIIRFKLLNKSVKPLKEVTIEHRTKILDFWCEYHDDAWNMGTQKKSSSLGFDVFKASSVPSTNISSPMGKSTLSRHRSLGSILSKTSPELSLPKEKQRLLSPIKEPRRLRYLRQCHSQATIPLPLPFVIGQTGSLDVAGLDLADPDILALAEAMPEVDSLSQIKLDNNAMLSDKAIAYFVKRLMQPLITTSLSQLSLSGCVRAGRHCVKAVVELITATFRLRHLNLSGVHIEHKFQMPLCEAISARPHLENVNLSDTGIGGGPTSHTKRCVKTLTQGNIHTLDISWNSFSAEFYESLGQCLAENTALNNLNLANSAANDADYSSTPLDYFLEQLWKAKSLQKIDLSMNRMNFRSALVLDDAIQYHKSLKHIILAENVLGSHGVRSCLRALCCGTNGLKYFDCRGGFSGEEPRDDDGEVFSLSTLGGTYKLQLHKPYHRSLLRMLYKAIERLNLGPPEVLSVVSSTQGFSHGAKNTNGIWEVQSFGEVVLNFNLENCLQSSVFNDVSDVGGVISRFFEVVRTRPAPEKLIQFFARWKELDGCHHEQTVFLKALSKDFYLSLSELDTLAMTSQLFKASCVTTLLPSTPHSQSAHFLSQLRYATSLECVRCRTDLKQLLNFNAQNPTGQYKLDLEKSGEFAVAERLVLLDKWEALIDKRLKRFDASEVCNRSHARNALYQGRPLTDISPSFSQWNLAESDMLQLDYASTRVPRKGEEKISEHVFRKMLWTAQYHECDGDVVVAVLRSLAHLMYIDSKQMRALFGIFPKREQRNEAFVTFFNRLVDVHDSKLYKVRFENYEDMLSMQSRIGFVRCFPFIQPEGSYFRLDLRVYDQRVCLLILVTLAFQERIENIRDPEYVLPNGTLDPLGMGVPRSWLDLKYIPTGGVFKCTYICAPEDRNFSLRKQLCYTYCYNEVTVPESQVTWWTGLGEAPLEVIHCMLFLRKKAPDFDTAFDKLNSGNGDLALGEMIAGLEGLGYCEPKEVVTVVFRYLDPDGGGSVSRLEFKVLTQLWQEVELCAEDFVAFLVRTFGSDLNKSWAFIDTDGDGELTPEEWSDAVKNLGYFGPSSIVYSLIDDDGSGAVTVEEFKELEKYLRDN